VREYPLDREARTRLRDEGARRIQAEAEEAVKRYGHSINCGGSRGWSFDVSPEPPHECRNDGTTCLCVCHDGGA
jgi:hypothetical protein